MVGAGCGSRAGPRSIRSKAKAREADVVPGPKSNSAGENDILSGDLTRSEAAVRARILANGIAEMECEEEGVCV